MGYLKDISFSTIAGSGPNGAIVHYRVTRASNRAIGKNELFLVNSGAQYEDGTTDITRTVAVGTPSDEMRDRFTRVLKGHIAIATAVFPENTSGAQLDPLARTALWQAGLDFDHGTGHGVGSYLSVHEGPARISKLGTVALRRGMILSNEPGYYKTAAYGVRIENLLLVIAAPEPAGAEKPLNAFETLTLAADRPPADRHPSADRQRAQLDRQLSRACAGSAEPPARRRHARLARCGDPAAGNLMDARTSASQAPGKQVTPWRLLALLMAMTAIGPATLNILVPALPGLVTRLASDTGTVQLTLSLYLLSLAAAQLLLGPLSDRFGRRPVVLAGLALSVVASLAAIAASSIGALIGARVVQAIGASTGIVIGRAIIRDLFERERAAAMFGLVTTAMVIAPMISPLIGGILDTAFGWEAIFLFLALFSGAVLTWAFMVLPETRPATMAHAPGMLWQETRGLLASTKFYGYVLCGALGSAPFFTFLGGGPYVVVTQMGRSSAEFGLWFALMSFGYMSGNFTASRLSQRFGVDAMIMAGVVFELIGASLTALLVATMPEAGPAIIFLPQLVISFGNGLLLPNAIAGAVSVRPQAAGTAAGMTGFTQMAIGAASTQMVTVLLAGASTAMPLAWMMLAAVLATGVAYGALVRR